MTYNMRYRQTTHFLETIGSDFGCSKSLAAGDHHGSRGGQSLDEKIRLFIQLSILPRLRFKYPQFSKRFAKNSQSTFQEQCGYCGADHDIRPTCVKHFYTDSSREH